jgi:hypothetical protein
MLCRQYGGVHTSWYPWVRQTWGGRDIKTILVSIYNDVSATPPLFKTTTYITFTSIVNSTPSYHGRHFHLSLEFDAWVRVDVPSGKYVDASSCKQQINSLGAM